MKHVLGGQMATRTPSNLSVDSLLSLPTDHEEFEAGLLDDLIQWEEREYFQHSQYAANADLKARNATIDESRTIIRNGTQVRLASDAEFVALCAQYGVTLKTTIKAVKHTTDVLLANLVVNTHSGYHTRVPFNCKDAAQAGFSHSTLVRLRDELIAAGHIEYVRGYKDLKTGTSYQSLLRFHEDSPIYQWVVQSIYIDILRLCQDRSPYAMVRNKRRDVTMLEGDSVPAQTQQFFKATRMALENSTLTILCADTNDCRITLFPKIDTPLGKAYDLTQAAVCHQVFNRKDLSTGGRYYTYLVQLPKALRRLVRINGVRVCEVDCVASHMGLLATMDGQRLAADPYEHPSIERKANKVMLLSAPNCTSTKQMRRKVASDLVDLDSDLTVQEWLDGLEQKHPWLVKHLGKNVGVRLQCIEAGIMCDANLQYMAMTGMPALSIHDASLVSCEHEDWMAYCILNAYRTYFDGVDPELLNANHTVKCGDTVYRMEDFNLLESPGPRYDVEAIFFTAPVAIHTESPHVIESESEPVSTVVEAECVSGDSSIEVSLEVRGAEATHRGDNRGIQGARRAAPGQEGECKAGGAVSHRPSTGWHARCGQHRPTHPDRT